MQPNNTNKRTKKVSNTNSDNNSHRERDLKRLQLTSNDVAKPETKTKRNQKKKSVLKAGMQENFEINDQYLDEFLDNNDI